MTSPTPVRRSLIPEHERRYSTEEAVAFLGIWKGEVYAARKEGRLQAFYTRTEEPVPAGVVVSHIPIFYTHSELRRFADTLRERTPPPPDRSDWMPRRGCKDVPPEQVGPIFYPEDHDYREARRLCFSCPVRLDCLRWAVKAGEQDGCWAGSRPTQLRLFGKAWRRDRRLPSLCAWCGEGFLPVRLMRGCLGSRAYPQEIYCRKRCADAGVKAGGPDSKWAS